MRTRHSRGLARHHQDDMTGILGGAPHIPKLYIYTYIFIASRVFRVHLVKFIIPTWGAWFACIYIFGIPVLKSKTKDVLKTAYRGESLKIFVNSTMFFFRSTSKYLLSKIHFGKGFSVFKHLLFPTMPTSSTPLRASANWFLNSAATISHHFGTANVELISLSLHQKHQKSGSCKLW